MYFGSSFALGIVLLIRASLAQSAPYFYQDSNEDEDALIDRLASLAAVVGSRQQLSRQSYPNYDLPQAEGYFDDTGGDDLLVDREYLAKLPRQLAYRPNDVRFYIPAEQFPNYSKDESDKADFETPKFRNPKQQEDEHFGPPISAPQYVEGHSAEHDTVGNQQYSHFMKKNEIKETQPAQHEQNIIAAPSHIMSSGHSVGAPSNILQNIDNANDSFSYSDIYYIGLIAGCSAAVVLVLVGAGILWYRIHQRVKAAAEVDYPAYGVTGPSKDVSPSGGDRKLAQSAQMYHYQHQKQQMAALQKGALQGDRQGSGGSDVESEDDNEDENDYTVYECPGLAPAGEMEVKNPLFQDEPTPVTPNLKSEEDK